LTNSLLNILLPSKCCPLLFVSLRNQILIGSSDWEDYSLGKDGVQRYRIHNLPNSSSCPGLYELGVALIPNDDGRKSRRHDLQNIIVVYLGQTNNVRTRLQRYGRVGAHLDSGKFLSSEKENECSGLFREVFSRGFSIMFRWAPVSKYCFLAGYFHYFNGVLLFFLKWIGSFQRWYVEVQPSSSKVMVSHVALCF